MSRQAVLGSATCEGQLGVWPVQCHAPVFVALGLLVLIFDNQRQNPRAAASPSWGGCASSPVFPAPSPGWSRSRGAAAWTRRWWSTTAWAAPPRRGPTTPPCRAATGSSTGSFTSDLWSGEYARNYSAGTFSYLQ